MDGRRDLKYGRSHAAADEPNRRERPGSDKSDSIPLLLGAVLVAGIVTAIVFYVRSRQ